MNTVKKFLNFKRIIATAVSLVMLFSISIKAFARSWEIPPVTVEPMLINIDAFEDYEPQFGYCKPALITGVGPIEVSDFVLYNGDLEIILSENIFGIELYTNQAGETNLIIDFDMDALSEFVEETVDKTLSFNIKARVVCKDNSGSERISFENLGEVNVKYFE